MDLLNELKLEINFRDTQFKLLYDLLIKSKNFIYPVLHLFGLSGTGKTYCIKKFMKKFCDSDNNRIYVYINCSEICYASVSLLFSEILSQVFASIPNSSEMNQEADIDMQIEDEAPMDEDPSLVDESIEDIRMNDCSTFLRHLKKILNKNFKKSFLHLIFDNADSMKYFNESSNLLLTLTKLDEYINMGDSNPKISISSIFISEIDWHSLISDCDLMSKTESCRPFIIYFNEYTKEEMNFILKKTALNLISIQDEFKNIKNLNKKQKPNKQQDVEFYSKIILDVFFPICKDLNEIQYLIQIYYDQLLENAESDKQNNETKDSYDRMMSAWNKMKPFLKQALTQIYLRQSMFKPTLNMNKKLNSPSHRDEFLSLEFESLNILNEKNAFKENITGELNKELSCNQLPKLMKYLLLSSYIATHNPSKYDKKLFEYNSNGKSRKSRFTAQKFQQTEDNQRSAALKTQSFDVNRLLAIFFAISTESGYSQLINLTQIKLNLKTLKSLHYIQQTNSSYSSIDEPKFKCLIDFETILNLANSLNFNIKQYLVEYITI